MTTPPEAPVVVVGAGAGGLLAAAFAAQAGARVLVLERTRQGGKKIIISGGGRCNVLPSALAPERYVTASSPHTLRRLLLSWPLEDQRRFFEEELGLPLVREEETGKLFPASNRAVDVRDGLVAYARACGADFWFDALVTDVRPGPERGTWTVHLANPSGEAAGEGQVVPASAVVVAAGGLSVPNTGSDGFGLRLARRLGHDVHPTYPALTPLTAEPPRHAALAGVSLRARLDAPLGRGRFSTEGGFLFTHRGYSGPAVLDVSHLAALARLHGHEQPIHVRWSPLVGPAWEEALRERSGTVAPVLRRHLPARLADALLAEAGVPADRPLAQLRREERARLVGLLTRYPLPWTGDEGYKKAEVTGGGVALGEVDPRTMESRRHPGLYFCGEVLDAFGPIGGYNFLWAWATGRLAGLGAARAAGHAPGAK